MISTLTGTDLILFQCVLSLHHLLQSSIFQKLGVASKVTTLAMDSIFSLRIVYSIYKQYLEFTEKYNCGRRVALHKLVSAMNYLQPWIDEPHRKDHQYRDRDFFWPPCV